jgi:iron complex transport system substrate-binding protein
MKRTCVAIAVALLVSWVLGACGSTPALRTTAEAPGGLTVTDALGRTVTFDAPPQRLVVAGKSPLTIVESLYLFPEASERLVGVVTGRQPFGDFLSLVDPSWGEKAKLAMDAGPEQIAPLAPDAVLLRTMMKDSLGHAVEELEIPVVYLDLETPDQYFRDVTVLGKLLGDEPRAEAIRASYQARLDHINGAVGNLGDGQKPRVLLVEYSEQGGEAAVSVPSASWLQTMEVELAGGAPVWIEAARAGGWTVVNLEQIAAWDPDQIFLISYSGDSAAVVEKLKAGASWQMLKAVQDGAIYGFPADILSWDQPDPRWILGVTWLAGKIHPDLFPGLDVRQEAIDFFQEMYGIQKGAIESAILPILTGSVP